MCRIFAAIGENNPRELGIALDAFRPLAACGCVPKGLTAGHRDGWGIVAYRRGTVVMYRRSAKDASEDNAYAATSKRVAAGAPSLVIAHFRKASVGGKGVRNAHPFVFGRYAFCHNGSIYGSERIPLRARSKQRMRGTTDSERFFLYLVEQIEASKNSRTEIIRGILRRAVRMIRKTLDYTALIIFFTDGTTLWALREVNSKNAFVRTKKLMGYYTLYRGTAPDGALFICSEKVLIPGVQWTAFPNHALGEVALHNTRCRMARI